MTNPSRHTEWLSLVEVSGPFLALPVLEKAFPQGLDVVETPKRQRLRAAYDEWCDAVEDNDPLLADLHREWIRLVFTEILEYDGSTLTTDAEKAKTYMVASPERTETFAPDWMVVSPSDGKPRLFVSVQRPGTDLEKAQKDDRWPASLLERMVALCRSHAVRLGVITDGERWTLVNAPVGGMSSYVSWYARLWFQEPITLKAFQSLWSVRRCFGQPDETLEALLDSSLEHHEEITDTLGEQVRRAVEVLVQCLDKADADRNGELLRDVSPAELYEAGLTVMMRLVFVLCAEERGLLLLGDPVYDECYAVSTLRGRLAEEADRHGPEVLDRRHDAWARLLAVFRAVHAGIDHEALRLPALGGSLFDPDRFPFLEGRSKGTSWRDSAAAPLPIDNRTVLLLLNSLQSLEQSGGALLLSYRALDVEQIGHVYEGLLEHTVARMPSVTIGLTGSKKAKNPNLPLSELESARMDGEDTLVALVKETTERSESAIRNALTRPVDETVFGRLLAVCGGDTTLAERIRPFANLVRTDAWGEPIVYREGGFMVTLGADRRETGTHYTPKSLTEAIVETTLEPVVYIGPAEGKPRAEWKLKTSAELLELKICDPAMGSGAFLVQACRWLAERLVEAWAIEEAAGRFVTADGEVKPSPGGADPLPGGMDERLLTARRLIAERCLYGVDVNPLAVELAKLSIWLVTLAKGRPFGFLDHNLRHGDSLLGIHRLDQLTKLTMNPDEPGYQPRLFGQNIGKAVEEAMTIRMRLRSIPIRDIRDVETMARLDAEARKKLEAVELVADAMIGTVLANSGQPRRIDSALNSLAVEAGEFLNGDAEAGKRLSSGAKANLSVERPKDEPPRRPLHWPLVFPEVFAAERRGFDAVVGNPPYVFGELRPKVIPGLYRMTTGQWDLCWLFVERAFHILIAGTGGLGFVLPDAILAREEPAILRSFVLQSASSLLVNHVGAVFKAGVSVFALCVSLKPHSKPSYQHYSPSGKGACIPLGKMQMYPTRAWNAVDVVDTVSMQGWRCFEDVVTISRGEEVGKKHLSSLDGCVRKSGMVPVVAGAGVVTLLAQPEPTHVMPASLVEKSRSQYASPKIIAVKTGARVRAGIDLQNLVTLQSAYNIHLTPKAKGLTIEFLCAILVSSTANRLFIEPITRMKKLFPQITQGMIKAIRIPPVPDEIVARVTTAVNKWNSTRDERVFAEIESIIAKCYEAASSEHFCQEEKVMP